MSGDRLHYEGQAETNAEAWFNTALRPRKPEGSLVRTASTVAQLLNYDTHVTFHIIDTWCEDS